MARSKNHPKPGEQGFQRFHYKSLKPEYVVPVNHVETWKPEDTPVPPPHDLDAIYKTYLSQWEPFDDEGKWPNMTRIAHGKFNPKDTGTIRISTDGAASQRNGEADLIRTPSGGWAWINADSKTWAAGGVTGHEDYDNTVTEAYAILAAITETPRHRPLRIYTDSESSKDIYYKIRDTDYIPYTRLDHIIAAAVAAAQGRKVEIVWVRGHKMHEGNRLADRLAAWASKTAREGTPYHINLANHILANTLLHHRENIARYRALKHTRVLGRTDT